MKIALVPAVLVCAVAMPALAWADDYMDDRSNPTVLVRSLYNAINRKEYARAWDYYGDQKPAKTYDQFVAGYADTARVDVATGAVTAEGAAGSTYYQIAVAIRATDGQGSEKTFAGCYTARLSQPAIQAPPFMPMHVESGSLKPASNDGPLADAVPAACGDTPPTKADATVDKVVEMFKVAYADSCGTLMPGAQPGAADPEVHVLKYRYTYDAAGDEEQEAKLVRFNCGSGAYNTNEIYYLATYVDGIRQLQFAQPELDIRYEDPQERTRLQSMTIIGYTATDRLVNSEFDPDDLSVTSWAKWRGVGDASSTGKWIFRNGDFTLVRYDVDPTEDGEIDPQTVLDFETAP